MEALSEPFQDDPLGVDDPVEVAAGDAVFDLDCCAHDVRVFRVGSRSRSVVILLARVWRIITVSR